VAADCAAAMAWASVIPALGSRLLPSSSRDAVAVVRADAWWPRVAASAGTAIASAAAPAAIAVMVLRMPGTLGRRA
jgi:hypothetical protein